MRRRFLLSLSILFGVMVMIAVSLYGLEMVILPSCDPAPLNSNLVGETTMPAAKHSPMIEMRIITETKINALLSSLTPPEWFLAFKLLKK